MDLGLLSLWILLGIIVVVPLLMALYLYVSRNRKKRNQESSEERPYRSIEEDIITPVTIERSVLPTDAKKAREDLRILGVEREILSYAIRRLYEAQAEGHINEEERERLALEYKNRMRKVKTTISKSESLIALHELETMQGDLVKLFSDKFDEINGKIENLRSSLDIKFIKEVPTRVPPPPSEKEGRETKKTRKPPVSKKTEAEKRIDEIRAEVEKVLERLGQIEVEA